MSTSGKIIIYSESRILKPIPLPIFEDEKKVDSSAASSGIIDAEIESIYRDIKKIIASEGKRSNDKTFSGAELNTKAKKLGSTGNLGNKSNVIAFIVDKYREYEALKKETNTDYDDINIGIDSDNDGSNNGDDSDDYYD